MHRFDLSYHVRSHSDVHILYLQISRAHDEMRLVRMEAERSDIELLAWATATARVDGSLHHMQIEVR